MEKKSKKIKLKPFLSGFSGAMVYVCGFAVILSAVSLLILLVVNVEREEMFLPPSVRETAEMADGEAMFEVSVGRGVVTTVADSELSFDKIKTILYAYIVKLIVVLAAATWISHCASAMLKSSANSGGAAKFALLSGIGGAASELLYLFADEICFSGLLSVFVGGENIAYAFSLPLWRLIPWAMLAIVGRLMKNEE